MVKIWLHDAHSPWTLRMEKAHWIIRPKIHASWLHASKRKRPKAATRGGTWAHMWQTYMMCDLLCLEKRFESSILNSEQWESNSISFGCSCKCFGLVFKYVKKLPIWGWDFAGNVWPRHWVIYWKQCGKIASWLLIPFSSHELAVKVTIDYFDSAACVVINHADSDPCDCFREPSWKSALRALLLLISIYVLTYVKYSHDSDFL